MPVKVKSRSNKSRKQEFTFPLEKENFVIIGIGILTLVIGYILMAENSVDGFLPTVVAPVLLVLGYCVIIPYGILRKSKTSASDSSLEVNSNASDKSGDSGNVLSPNIKTSGN